MRWKSWALSLLLFLLFGSSLPFAHATAELVDRIIAYVNVDIITLSELDEKTKAIVAARDQNPFLREQEQSLESIRRDILDHLINELLAEQEISRLKISVSDAEVDDTIARIRQEKHLTQETFAAELRKQGMTIEDFRQQVRKTLEQRKLINREVRSQTVITDEMVEEYYQANIRNFRERRDGAFRTFFCPIPAQPPRKRRLG